MSIADDPETPKIDELTDAVVVGTGVLENPPPPRNSHGNIIARICCRYTSTHKSQKMLQQW